MPVRIRTLLLCTRPRNSPQEDGRLVLANPTADYFRGFTLQHARRGDDRWRVETFAHETGDPAADSRIAPVTHLVHRFLHACEIEGTPSPGFAEGNRVQYVIDAAERSHVSGRWIDIPLPGREVQA